MTNPFVNTTARRFDVDLAVALTPEQRDRTNTPSDGYAVLVDLGAGGWPQTALAPIPAGTRLVDMGTQPGDPLMLWLVGDDGLVTPSTEQPERGDLIVSMVGVRDQPFFQAGGILTVTGHGEFGATEGAGGVVATTAAVTAQVQAWANDQLGPIHDTLVNLGQQIADLNERAGTQEGVVAVMQGRLDALEAAANQ